MNRLAIISILVIVFALPMAFSGCDYDSEEDLFPPEMVTPMDTTDTTDTTGMNTPDTASWSMEVKPIIDNSCATAGCHLNAQSPFLNSYQAVVDNVDRVEARALVEMTMPPSGALSSSDRDLLQDWIDKGTPNN